MLPILSLLFSPQFVVSQLLSYDPAAWLAFITIVASAAYWGRWRGVIGDQALVAALITALITFLDLDYQGHQPQDMDFVFSIGLCARILLVNTVLLPVGAVALWRSYRKSTPAPP